MNKGLLTFCSFVTVFFITGCVKQYTVEELENNKELRLEVMKKCKDGEYGYKHSDKNCLNRKIASTNAYRNGTHDDSEVYKAPVILPDGTAIPYDEYEDYEKKQKNK